MKKIFGTLLIIICASYFVTIEIFAQKTTTLEESILIEFNAPTEVFSEKRSIKFDVPVGRSFKERQGAGGGIASGSASGCSHCSQETFERINKERPIK